MASYELVTSHPGLIAAHLPTLGPVNERQQDTEKGERRRGRERERERGRAWHVGGPLGPSCPVEEEEKEEE